MASGETGVFDLYGFELTVTPQDKADRYVCAQYAQRREAKWEPFVKAQALPDARRLKRFVRKGVPPVLRGWVWWHTSGAAAFRERYGHGHYASMVAAGEERPCVRQIDLDLPRTFPRNAWVSSPDGVAALRRVLLAYCAHNPGVGYCQGMNFLAALLLLAVEKDDERCFWLLVALLEGILYPKTYAPNLDGCHVEMRVLGQLLATKAPKLSRHLNSIGCEASMFATDWFLVLFATTLPSETAARVWDCLFLEGPKVVFRVGVALLEMHAPLLMRKDNAGEVLKALKDACARVHNRDALMAAAFQGVGSFPMARIRELRARHQREVDDMLAARAAAKRKGSLRSAISQAQAMRASGTSGGGAA
ncbi:hypothetical protein Rsub_07959 [Raphidocelis subcapitata]|uniref:Rab-GAP TBC domain-containing protein n=1 Tax=Raphidocelis subcapitata TaxID=307507 RepID=A0A2V0PC85_9CHLO|nr:hypothetical protein Rsub_07959 [Raphidocelis subcapitata]|eukprot:GBF94787.1 hypothetical protein Rsub_07959 [Raphidocelis subcapitata]